MSVTFTRDECNYFNWGNSRGYVPDCLVGLTPEEPVELSEDDLENIYHYLYEDESGFSCASLPLLDKLQSIDEGDFL